MSGEAMPTGREKPGEHWNARLIREADEAERRSLASDSIDVTPLAVAICHRLHLMNENPLPCRACISKIAKALPVLTEMFGQVRQETAETIALAIEAHRDEPWTLEQALGSTPNGILSRAASIARENGNRR